jgi:integrase
MNSLNPDDQYLLKQFNRYHVVVEVPKRLRDVVGKRRLRKSLETTNLKTARERRLEAVAELKRKIAEAAAAHLGEQRSIIAAGMSWKKHASDDHDLDGEAHEIAKKHGEETAKAFAQVAAGDATPLDALVETWLAGTTYTERTKMDCRTSVRKLEAFLQRREVLGAATIEGVTGKIAARFRDEALVKAGVHFKTGNKLLSCLRRYWNWMRTSEHLDSERPNPWKEKSLPKPKARAKEDKERPFSDAEIAKLLFTTPKDMFDRTKNWRFRQDDRDVCFIGALSGMREEEVFQLRIADVAQGGYFDVTKAKTQAGVRQVPIHPDLRPIIARLAAGREGKEFLIADAEATGWDGARGMAFSKRFATFRRKLGVDDMLGQGGTRRRSRVNFHSFRRWFSTKCEQAGIPEHLTARVLGHEIASISYGVYSGGASVEQLRGVVEAVKLPHREPSP